jgi:hypothetical protein
MREAARTSETSVDNYFTRQKIPEDKSELHTRCRENLKFHNIEVILKETGYQGVDCLQLVPDRIQWWALVNSVMKLLVP